MKALKSKVTRGIPVGSKIETCDNSGARLVQVVSVKGQKGRHGRRTAAGIGDLVTVAVKKGRQDMRKQVVQGVIVRQKKEFRRADGTRIKFEDNAIVIIKDDLGNPKGTMIKGPIAKEVVERWPAVAKIASIIL